MLGCFFLSTQSKVKELIKDIWVFSLIVSGLCHDVDHSGFSNSFEINSFSNLAMVYNDKSVQKNKLLILY